MAIEDCTIFELRILESETISDLSPLISDFCSRSSLRDRP
jgi:hypothetical protein